MSTNGHVTNGTVPKMKIRHPLEQLTAEEVEVATAAVLKAREANIIFRNVFTAEPPKAELTKYLNAEHAGTLTSETPRPAREACVHYDVVNNDRTHQYMESTVDVLTGKEVNHRIVETAAQHALTMDEFRAFEEACLKSPLWKKAIAEFNLPEGFEIVIDPWPYGGPDAGEETPRYTQGLVFAKDTRSKNPDSNHYSYPIPIIPVLDTYKGEIVRIDRLATGGREDGLKYGTANKGVIDHCRAGEYVPELLDVPLRTNMKPINVVQPEGASFKVTDESLVEWGPWSFRVGFNPRECVTIHDVRFDNRAVMYRLSLSEMTVPYGDPRPPFHRKQAFDFGDAGAGRAANNLGLGCDCLGAIKYFDALLVNSEGKPSTSKSVVCLHEQDSGIGWKHTNFRTSRAVVTRHRELVVQFIITLANYEYVFAYKFDLAGGITIETRATGIVSVVNIDPGKTSPYGTVVSPGALAQNHQHIFAIRMDPSVDGHNNTVVTEETLSIPMNPETNPHGNGYQVVSTPIKTSTHLDASPFANRTIKITNPSKTNPISGRNIAYKFIPSATQLLLADKASIVAKRAQFAQHHIWVTSYKDAELFAGGEFTNQSQAEVGGVFDAAQRGDNVENSDVVVWNVFGFTHNPRVEDWPVMPVEVHELKLRPSDFFERNPSINVKGTRNESSVLVNGGGECCEKETAELNGNGTNGEVQDQPTSHLQGVNTIPVNGSH